MLARLRHGAARFVKLSIDDRVALARSMQAGYLRIAEPSVRAACAAKGIDLGTPLEGEEWTLGPWCVVRHLRLVQQSLLAIKQTGTTPLGKAARTADGRLTVQVYPTNGIDGVLFNKVSVDVHLLPDVDERRLAESRAGFYRAPRHDGRVCLVLGAGNVNAIVSQDALTKLFNDGTVCLLKMNPVNAYLGPFLEEAYTDAIRQGFLAVAHGGADVGEYLVRHPMVDEVHVTGSDQTYDRIVWGPPGPEQAARKADGRRLTDKPVHAELGNVSPVIVVPGPYTDAELAHQAEDIASALTYNASFDCNAAKVVVTPKEWSGRDRLLRGIEAALAKAPPRRAYYPGARERWELFTRGRPTLRTFGASTGDALPWAFAPGIDPDVTDDVAFTTEAFAPVLFETSVGSADPVEFVSRAVAFANERLWGTLNATLVVHPRTAADPACAAAVEWAIRTLRYGSVGVNAWVGLLFAFGSAPWGAYPGARPEDIQSGIGWVHNTAMLEGIEKAVLRHPLVAKPKPGYHLSHRTSHRLMRRMTEMEERAGWGKVPGIIAAAMRG
jgi:aldehyde dehydrogenase (NAD(P)+)